MILTCASVGHISLHAFGRTTPMCLSAPLSPSHARAASRVLSSFAFGSAALCIGAFASAAASFVSGGSWSAGERAPLYLGMTFAIYSAGSRVAASPRVPPVVKLFFPPTICTAAGLILLTFAGDEPLGVQAELYTQGAGAALMAPVSPAMVTFGLFTHTYHELLRTRLLPLLAVAAVTVPGCLLATAAVGRYVLHLPPSEIASMLPATTTTGLALTMDTALPNAKREWIAMGPVLCGVSGMLIWPLLLRATGLACAPAAVRGLALGSTFHVSAMAALTLEGDSVAADFAAMGFFVMGVVRTVLLQSVTFQNFVAAIYGATRDDACCGASGTSDVPPVAPSQQ